MNILTAGDTFPNPTADLNADVTGCTIRFRMMHLDGRFHLEGPASIADAAQGIVFYDWQPGNTNTVGAYRCQFHVTYPSGDVQRFPQDSYLELIIRPAVPVA